MNAKIKQIIFFFLVFVMPTQGITNNFFDSFKIPDSLYYRFSTENNIQKKIDAANDIIFYISDKEPSKILTKAQRLIFIADSVDYLNGLFDATNNLGIIFLRLSQFLQAISCFEECLKITKELKDKGREAAIVSNIALVYSELNMFEKAIDYHLEALKIRENRKDTLAISLSYNNLAMTYHYKSDYSTALKYYKKAIEVQLAHNYKVPLANSYNNLGQLFFDMYADTLTWTLDSAEFYFLKAYNQYFFEDNKVNVAKTLLNIGNTYALANNFEKAIDAYRAALNIQKQLTDSLSMALTYYNMGLLFFNLNEDNRAVEFIKNSLTIAQKFNHAALIKDNSRELFEFYSKKNNYQLANFYAQLFFALNDSLMEVTRLQLYETFTGKFNFQYFENYQLKKENIKYKNFFVISSVVLVLSIVCCILIFKRYYKLAGKNFK